MSNVSSIYQDGTYATKNPEFGDDNAEWKIRNAIRCCRSNGLAPKSLAEVGCGGGAILLGVADALKVESAVGYEPMPEAFALASTRGTDTVRFLHETVGPGSSADFDLVLCFDVFEHVRDCFGFLENLRGMGRKFMFHIPLDMNAQMVARGEPIQRVRDVVGHIHYFSRDSAIALLEETGYRIQDEFYTCGSDGTYDSLAYRLMSVPRRLAFAAAPHLAVRILGGYSLMVLAE